MNLAAASGSDLATTSDIVTDALTAMGYSAGDAGRLADVMAAASSSANTNVDLMGNTFKYVAPIVGALGYSMEDTALAIALMANAGLKGEQAGTALRSVLTRLSAPPKECADAMGINKDCISFHLKGKLRHAGNHTFEKM
jgi:TP901 family phage tail tape measure protein